ncbi:MAG: PTS sugar transporter subunit IIA [Candidatus Neomarinimicrobiota bacterium]
MKIIKYFNLETKNIVTQAGTKHELLEEIARSAVQSKTLENIDPKALLKQLKAREALGSTGFGDGIAIPHCTLSNIDDFVIGALVSEDGIDFNALDGAPVKLFVYIIAPAKKRNTHIKILSEIAKVLKNPSHVKTLCKQKDSVSFFDELLKFSQWGNTEDLPQEYSQINIHVQDAEVFDYILELLSEVEDIHLSVIEANNVGKYLYALPLFSHFMNEEHKGFHHIIHAVVNRVYVNDTLRKIKMIIQDNNCESKAMVTSHSLSFFFGNLDI